VTAPIKGKARGIGGKRRTRKKRRRRKKIRTNGGNHKRREEEDWGRYGKRDQEGARGRERSNDRACGGRFRVHSKGERRTTGNEELAYEIL